MKILILGGDGFIGSHLRDAHLERGDEVTIIDKDCLRSKRQSNYTFIQKELTCSEDLVDFNMDFDFAYNCIAVANPGFYVKYPQQTYDIDFRLNLELITVLQSCGIPYMHFSTSEVYGKKWEEPYNEETTNLIMGPVQNHRWIYATSKILLEQLILSNTLPRNQAVIVRPFNFVGHDIDWIPAYQGQKEWIPRVYSCFMNSLFRGTNLQIVSPGSQRRCYTYIDDAIEALLSIVDNFDKCKGRVINVGVPDNEITISGLACKMICYWMDITGSKRPTSHTIRIDGEDLYGKGYEDSERRIPDISLIKSLTGWEPKTNLHDTFYKSMVQTIEMLKKHE